MPSLNEPVSPCEHIEVEMCQGLSYNFTSFPNIWLSIADQREAATLLGQYRVKVTLKTPQAKPHQTAGAVSSQDTKPSPTLSPFCHPGTDGAGVLRASAEAGLRDVSAPVQPSWRRPPALPLGLLLGRAAVQPSSGSLLLQLALQLPPSPRLAGPPGVLAALKLH